MQYTYHIKGMHCSSCIEKIKSALAQEVTVVSVTLNPPRLIIEANQKPPLQDLNQYIAKAGSYTLHIEEQVTSTTPNAANAEPTAGLRTYYPIFLIAAYIMGVASINSITSQGINWQTWMNQFMAGFFLVFSAFKLLDLPGFADGYATYDLLAKRWHSYGFIYPFLELSLGLLYLLQWLPNATYFATIIIMGFSSIGVVNSLIKKQRFLCACLGTLLKVPLSSITLIEDLSMVVLAALALLMY